MNFKRQLQWFFIVKKCSYFADCWISEKGCLSVQKAKTDRENHSLTGKLSRDNEIKEKDWLNGRTYNQLSIVLNQEKKGKDLITYMDLVLKKQNTNVPTFSSDSISHKW